MPLGSSLSFELVITKGPGEGTRYAFAQSSTSIGRADDNDLVLRIAGVSRRHARITEQGGRFVIEDLGSSNGTWVNGDPIGDGRALVDGDEVEVGPITLSFALQVQPAKETRVARTPVRPAPELGEEAAGTDRTRELTRIKGPIHTPTDPAALEVVPTPHVETQVVEAEKLAAPRLKSETRIVDRSVAEAPARGLGSGNELATLDEEPELSVAERFRLRRESQGSVAGQLKLFWVELSVRQRKMVLGAAGLLVLAMVGLTAASLFGGGRGPDIAEPEHLGLDPVMYSFGLGEGVTFRRPEMKAFYFEFTAPTQAVGVLRYEAANISDQEVSITINGVEHSFVPADTLVPDRELEAVFAPSTLKKNATNTVIFDNTRNPPGDEPWQVANLRLEIIPVPDLPKDELVARALEFSQKGREFESQREVAPDNLFKAWKSYRQAWLTLMAIPDPERLDAFRVARDQMSSLAREMDHQCRTMMLDAKRAMELNSPDLARQTLEEVPRYFPTTEHRCHNLARQKVLEYGL